MDFKKLSYHLFSVGALLCLAALGLSFAQTGSAACAFLVNAMCVMQVSVFLGFHVAYLGWLGIAIVVISQVIKYSLKSD